MKRKSQSTLSNKFKKQYGGSTYVEKPIKPIVGERIKDDNGNKIYRDNKGKVLATGETDPIYPETLLFPASPIVKGLGKIGNLAVDAANPISGVGTKRLYRIENPNINNKYFAKRGDLNLGTSVSHEDLVGQWFSDDIEKPLTYLQKSQKQPGSQVVYIDIPVNELEKYKAINHPIASKMDIEPTQDYIISDRSKATIINLDDIPRRTGNYETWEPSRNAYLNKLMKKQYGGTSQNILAEDGELYLDENGEIQEVNSFSHDDPFVELPNGQKMISSKGNGGQILDDAQSVLSDSYTQVEDGDRKNTQKEQQVAIKSKDAKKLFDYKWFNAGKNKKYSPSELVREVISQRDKRLSRYSDAQKDDALSLSTNQLNASLMPSDEDIYDVVLGKQEDSKGNSKLFIEGSNKGYYPTDEELEFAEEYDYLPPSASNTGTAQYGKIVVNDQNDPRLQAYKDSAALYNNYQEVTKALKNQNYIKETPQDREYTKGDIYNQLKINKKYNIDDSRVEGNLKSVSDFIPEIYNKTLPRQLYSDTIKPAGTDTYKFKNPKDKWYTGFKNMSDALGITESNTKDFREEDRRMVARYDNVKPKQEVIYQPKQEESVNKIISKRKPFIRNKYNISSLENEVEFVNDVEMSLPNITVPQYKIDNSLESLPAPNRGETMEAYQQRLAGLRNEFPNKYRTNRNQVKKQFGGIPINPNGLYEEDGPVIIPSNSITMESIPIEVDAYDADTNEYLTRMQPNMNYKFKNSENILEIPVAQFGEDGTYFPPKYTIKQGDSLSKIAESYGLTLQQLLDENPTIANANRINVGDTLTIPDVTIKANRAQEPVDRMSEIADIQELPEELDVQAEDVIPTLDVSNIVENVAPITQANKEKKKEDDKIKLGKIDRTQGTNALREMMRANRSINLPYRTETPRRLYEYLEEDVTPYLDELDSQSIQALQNVNQNTAQGQAIAANILNRVGMNKRQIINRANATNLQRRQQVDNQNVALQNQFDLMQEQSNKNYVDETYQTLANYDRNRVQQAEYLDEMINQNTRTNNFFTLENMRNPNYQIDPVTGEVYRIGTPLKQEKKAQFGIKRKKNKMC